MVKTRRPWPWRRSASASPTRSNDASSGRGPPHREETRIRGFRRFDNRRSQDETRVNERIRAREIRVIGSDGEQLGIMDPADALEKAREEGLDLVEVAANSSPPVCRIMDYGRYKYEQKKKTGKSKGHTTSLKEVKLRPRTDMHDLDFKLKNARRFLMDGDKVKVTVMFRGREIVHTNLGRRQLDQVVELLKEIAKVESVPKMEGRFMSMILVPDREGIAAEVKRQEAEAAANPESAEAESSASSDAEEPAAEAAEAAEGKTAEARE